jgi:hypothetical protein
MKLFKVIKIMVTCKECETKNDENANYCVKCGVKLETFQEESWDKRMEKWGEEVGKRAEEWGEDFGRRAEQECLGLPKVGVFFSLLIGAIIILVGIAWLIGIALTQYFWPLIIIGFGILILAGTIYRLIRRH